MKKLKDVIKHEREVWNNIYQKQINEPQKAEFSSFWWKYYYQQMKATVRGLLCSQDQDLAETKILEVGSGTGKASLLSIPEAKITFLDLAENGFILARKLAEVYEAKYVKYVVGDMFSLPFSDDEYDFVWNVGAIEHYDTEYVKLALSEMLRVTRLGGVTAVAIPNYNSLPMLKARILGNPLFEKYLRWIPGYRANSEKGYSSSELLALLEEIASTSGFLLKNKKVSHIGSPALVESSNLSVTVMKPIEFLFPKAKFLLMVSVIKAKE